MKFTAEQQAYLERVIDMDGFRITCVDDDIYGDVKGDVFGDVKGAVYGKVKGDVIGDVFRNVFGEIT